MKFLINGELSHYDKYQSGKIIDGRFYESLRELEKYGGGDPNLFYEKWDNGETAINIISQFEIEQRKLDKERIERWNKFKREVVIPHQLNKEFPPEYYI